MFGSLKRPREDGLEPEHFTQDHKVRSHQPFTCAPYAAALLPLLPLDFAIANPHKLTEAMPLANRPGRPPRLLDRPRPEPPISRPHAYPDRFVGR